MKQASTTACACGVILVMGMLLGHSPSETGDSGQNAAGPGDVGTSSGARHAYPPVDPIAPSTENRITQPEAPAEPWRITHHTVLPQGVPDEVRSSAWDEERSPLRVRRNQVVMGAGDATKVVELREFQAFGRPRPSPGGNKVLIPAEKAGRGVLLIIDGNAGTLQKQIDESMFRDPNVEIPNCESQSVMWIDDAHLAHLSLVDPPGFPGIDKQHRRVVIPVFGGKPEVAPYHYVLAIRNLETDGITVLSIPIPPDLMVEFLEPLRTPGWIAVNTRKDGENSPTRSWVRLQTD